MTEGVDCRAALAMTGTVGAMTAPCVIARPQAVAIHDPWIAALALCYIKHTFT